MCNRKGTSYKSFKVAEYEGYKHPMMNERSAVGITTMQEVPFDFNTRMEATDKLDAPSSEEESMYRILAAANSHTYINVSPWQARNQQMPDTPNYSNFFSWYLMSQNCSFKV